MRQLSTIFEQFEIAILPFPFVDAPRSKPRPALSSRCNPSIAQNGHTLLAMITTAGHTRWPSDYAILELGPTGLRVGCVVRWKVFTLPNRALHRRLGHLGEPDKEGCRAALARMFEAWHVR